MKVELPPWRPIAEWLLRIDDAVPEHKESRSPEDSEYEIQAKAIAYDIAIDGTTRIDPEEIKRELREDSRGPSVKMCPECQGHGGVPGDVCEACGGTGREDGESNIR